MTRRSSALALALLLFLVPVSAQAPAEPLQVPYRLVTLDNGLTVIRALNLAPVRVMSGAEALGQ